MTDSGSTHFGSDDELLSAYVLGRLGESERLAIDRHAATCASCSEALRREMMLAAGTRKLGRETLKAELRRKIGPRREPSRVPLAWSAAAALFLAAGLGAYYLLRSGGTIPAGPGETPPLAAKREQSAQHAPAPPGTGANTIQDKGAVSTALSGAEAENKQKISPPSSRVTTENERRSEPAGEIAAAPAAVGSATGGGEFWSDGIVESAPQSHDAPRGAAMQSEKSLAVSAETDARRDESQVKEESRRLRPAGEQMLKKDVYGRGQGEFQIRQESARTLPGGKDQIRKTQVTVPTRVDQRGGTTTMTMYLDSLVDDRELKNARVEALRDDSLIVTIGGKRILYHFPRGQGTAGGGEK